MTPEVKKELNQVKTYAQDAKSNASFSVAFTQHAVDTLHQMLKSKDGKLAGIESLKDFANDCLTDIKNTHDQLALLISTIEEAEEVLKKDETSY